jgi:hypothetical protein
MCPNESVSLIKSKGSASRGRSLGLDNVDEQKLIWSTLIVTSEIRFVY